MQATLKAKVSEIFTKYNFSREDAGFISDVLSEIENRQDEKFQISKELFLTQKDKTDIIESIGNGKVEFIERIENVRVDLIERIKSSKSDVYKAVFAVGIIQLLAIVGSLPAILNYMHK